MKPLAVIDSFLISDGIRAAMHLKIDMYLGNTFIVRDPPLIVNCKMNQLVTRKAPVTI